MTESIPILFLMIALLGLGLLISFSNFIHVKKFEDFIPGENQPFVSILVPARDEERSIETCVGSLLKQNYLNYEVLVLNDHSTDRTGAILQCLAKNDPRLRVIDGEELPEGWPGKHWACHQLAKVAKGDYLLFTDADTCHEPHALACAVVAAQQNNAALVTAIPCEEVHSWGEKLIVPFISFGMTSFLPLHLAQKKQLASLSVTIGQFMLFRRSVYEEIGGYSAACKNVNDDVLLGRTLMQMGYRWMILDGTDTVSCRMYHSFTEAVDGFSKNVFGFFDYVILPYLLVWSAVIFLFLEPLRILAIALTSSQMNTLPAKLALILVVESVSLFMLAYHRLGIPFYMVAFYWLTVLLFSLIALRSMVLTLAGHASWKGRTLQNVEPRWL
jgi:chlorobactene glucosyltransferase